MTAQDHVVGPDGHVDVDVLSDLVEGLLTEAEAAEAEVHVATCADCRDTRDALAEVRVLLAGQPAEPMPDDVFARIETALADAAADDARSAAGAMGAEVPTPRPESTPGLASLPPPRPRKDPDIPSNVVDLDAVRRKRLGPMLLGVAAAAAAVVFGVVVATGGLDSGSDSHNADSAPANSRAEGSEQTLGATGKPGTGAGAPPGASAPSASSLAPSSSLPVYTSGTVQQLVGNLLNRQSVSSATSTGGAVGGSPSAGDSGSETGTGKAVAPVPSCVTSAAQKVADGRQPTASERALYLEQVAYVLVYVEPNGRDADVVIVSAACAEVTPQQSLSGSASPQPSRVLLSTSVPLR